MSATQSPSSPSASDSSLCPSALSCLPVILSHISCSTRVCIFLDYDGTLTPIVSEPSQAFLSPSMRAALEAISSRYVTSIVTGRRIETIQHFVGLPSLYLAASHGFDIRGPHNQPLHQVAQEFLPALQSIRTVIQSQLFHYPGAALEDNVYSLSLHYRNIESQTNRDSLLQYLDSLLSSVEYQQFVRLPGKMLWEIRPRIDWHKGAAISMLMNTMMGSTQQHKESSDEAITLDSVPSSSESTQSSTILPIFLGDDMTDEDGFRELEKYPNSVTVFVTAGTHRDTRAKYTLESVAEVERFLLAIANSPAPPSSAVNSSCASSTAAN